MNLPSSSVLLSIVASCRFEAGSWCADTMRCGSPTCSSPASCWAWHSGRLVRTGAGPPLWLATGLSPTHLHTEQSSRLMAVMRYRAASWTGAAEATHFVQHSQEGLLAQVLHLVVRVIVLIRRWCGGLLIASVNSHQGLCTSPQGNGTHVHMCLHRVCIESHREGLDKGAGCQQELGEGRPAHHRQPVLGSHHRGLCQQRHHPAGHCDRASCALSGARRWWASPSLVCASTSCLAADGVASSAAAAAPLWCWCWCWCCAGHPPPVQAAWQWHLSHAASQYESNRCS